MADQTITDIKELDLSSLEQLISIYPWYQEAKIELINKLSEISKETAREKLKEFYSFIPFPEWIAYKLEKSEQKGKKSSTDKVIQSQINSAKQIFVVGGDYFSREELDKIKDQPTESAPIPIEAAADLEKKRSQDRIATKKELNPLIFYTETLAQIYTQQECWKEALEVYSKLILLYPEKSAYFADLAGDIRMKMSCAKQENNIKKL